MARSAGPHREQRQWHADNSLSRQRGLRAPQGSDATEHFSVLTRSWAIFPRCSFPVHHSAPNPMELSPVPRCQPARGCAAPRVCGGSQGEEMSEPLPAGLPTCTVLGAAHPSHGACGSSPDLRESPSCPHATGCCWPETSVPGTSHPGCG